MHSVSPSSFRHAYLHQFICYRGHNPRRGVRADFTVNQMGFWRNCNQELGGSQDRQHPWELSADRCDDHDDLQRDLTHLAGLCPGVRSPAAAGGPVLCAHPGTARLDDAHVKRSGQPGSNLLGLMMIPDHHDDRT
jgi:hypothetical protein